MSNKIGIRSLVVRLRSLVLSRFVGRLKLWKVLLVNSESELLKVVVGILFMIGKDFGVSKILFL